MSDDSAIFNQIFMSDPSAPRSKASSLVLVAALVAALGGFLFGYDTAVINGANQYLKLRFLLTPTQEGIAGASAILGCIPGAMAAGFLSDAFGRRRTLFLCAALYAFSGAFSAVAGTFGQFLAARFISGLGIGASSMICPIYIAELAPARLRGQLGSLFQLGIVVGIFLTLFINAGIQHLGDEVWNTVTGWRWMLGAEVVPALLLFVLLFFAPESPRWLIRTGRTEEARRVFSRVTSPAEANAEISTVNVTPTHEQDTLGELFHARFRAPLILAVVLMALSQFSGINAVMYYSTKIFASAGVGVKNAFASSVIVGFVNLVFTFVAVAFVDRVGRRSLLLVGLTLQVIALLAVGWMFLTAANGWPLLIAILAFIAAFAMALGPIPWIVCSEIFPTRVRGLAMSVATFVIWMACYVVAQTFPMLNENPSVGPAKTFWIYAACSLAGLIFVWMKLPETKGRTLEEIEANWLVPSGGPSAR